MLSGTPSRGMKIAGKMTTTESVVAFYHGAKGTSYTQAREAVKIYHSYGMILVLWNAYFTDLDAYCEGELNRSELQLCP
jgi:hypothetical protein